jgi:hypothetical protein
LADTGAVKLFGVAADRISEFSDIILLKAEARLVIAGMTGSPFARLRGRTHDASAPSLCRRLQPERVADDGEEIFPPIGDNPSKSPDSKK